MELINGILAVDGTATLRQGYTKQEFISSTLFLQVIKQNDYGYTWYYLKPQYIEKERFTISLIFRPNGLLDRIGLVFCPDGIIPDWSDWSEEHELYLKEKHDIILKKWLGKPPYQYVWGSISSTLDLRSASSNIIIRYN